MLSTAFARNKVRFALTALGMVMGSASVILVVTIGLTGKQYAVNYIQGIGANMITADYPGGDNGNPDFLTKDDLTAVAYGSWHYRHFADAADA